MATDSGIDPRYAAQFQRGFDPAQHPPTVERRGPTPIASASPPVVQRVPSPPPVVERIPGLVPAPDPAPDSVAEAHDDDDREAPRLNPEWLLAGLAAVLLAASLLVFWQAATDIDHYIGSTGMADYALALAVVGVPGPLFVGSVLTFTAWVVVRALRGSSPR